MKEICVRKKAGGTNMGKREKEGTGQQRVSAQKKNLPGRDTEGKPPSSRRKLKQDAVC